MSITTGKIICGKGTSVSLFNNVKFVTDDESKLNTKPKIEVREDDSVVTLNENGDIYINQKTPNQKTPNNNQKISNQKTIEYGDIVQRGGSLELFNNQTLEPGTKIVIGNITNCPMIFDNTK